LMWDQNSNDTIAEYVRDRIRERVDDPATAELLCPTDHPYGTKRPPFEAGYYEVFNLPDVDLVDVRSAPIEAVTPTGIRTSRESYEFDVIILATGFDAFTGASLAIPTTGRDGVTLQHKWADGPKNYLGLQIAGFPNLFTMIGPLSVASQYNTPLLIEDQVDFAAGAVQTVMSRGARAVDAAQEAESTWVNLVNAVFAMSLWAKAENSWFTGGNVAGKPRSAYLFPVGAPMYRAILAEVARSGYAGFTIDGEATSLPPLVRLDPGVALLLAAMLGAGIGLDEALTHFGGSDG
jgi:hypothetical protein